MQDVQDFAAGAVLFRQGDRPEAAYFIQSGKVEIAVAGEGEKKVLDVVGSNMLIGEMALIDPAPRMATATAVEPTQCRVITPQRFKDLLRATPPLTLHILRSLIRTARLKVGMPTVLTPDSGAHLRSQTVSNQILDRRVINAGAAIFREGSRADGIYVIQDGTVEIRRDGLNGEEVLRTYQSGEAFGERGVLDQSERAASAFAVTATTCEFVSAEQFRALLKETPPVLVGLMRIYIGHY